MPVITWEPLPATGLVTDGHGHQPADLRSTSAAWLTDHGRTPVEAEDIVTTRRAFAEAWWGADDVGFVAETHQAARPVTVLALAGA